MIPAPAAAQAVGDPATALGRFGPYGGRFVSEMLMPNLIELEAAWRAAEADPSFHRELDHALASYVGRPTPISFARRLSEHNGGGRIFLKREDLCHTGAHKINNAVGQILLAKRMGKKRIIAETGAGQHGVATATVCAWTGVECVIYMGVEDIRRQAPNVKRMELLGARLVPVESGTATLKDAMNEALRDWVTNVRSTFYLIGSVCGPHPYPSMVARFQSVIGKEARQQMPEIAGQQADVVVACVGGGSNAMGIFHPYLDSAAELVGAEAAGDGLDTGRHAASLTAGTPGILHGACTYLLQDPNGQVMETHSVSAGLDYPGVGPEHSFLKDSGRVRYVGVTDTQALDAFRLLCRTEGIIPALESAHALAQGLIEARRLGPAGVVLVNLSGRGDKDLDHYTRVMAARA